MAPRLWLSIDFSIIRVAPCEMSLGCMPRQPPMQIEFGSTIFQTCLILLASTASANAIKLVIGMIALTNVGSHFLAPLP
jgi:hypothetical protein